MAICRTLELRARQQSDYRDQNPKPGWAGISGWDLFGIAGREKLAHDFDNLAKAGPLLIRSPLTNFDSRSLRPALFLDRDGTINVEVHYLSQPEQLELLPTVAKTISAVNALGIAVVIVTNQAGIARGYFPEHRLLAIHERLQRMLSEQNARIDRIYFCPHHPTAGQGPYKAVCECRKPLSGMLRQAASELGIDLNRSLMVGDRERCGLSNGACDHGVWPRNQCGARQKFIESDRSLSDGWRGGCRLVESRFQASRLSLSKLTIFRKF